jgi:lysophospholipase L1-like esterase
MDQLPHMLRRRMQERFGDGGPGFVLLQAHSADYRHSLSGPMVGREWDFCFVIFRCRPDGHYGLGGVSFHSAGGSVTRYRTPRRGTLGRNVSRFELWYAAQPRGGRVAVQVDGDAPVIVSTDAAALEDRVHVVEVPAGEHTFVVRADGGGPLRAYGVVMESPGPGVVWDTLNMIGAFTSRLQAFDAEHIGAQVARRNAQLLVYSFGGNDLRRLAGRAITAEGVVEETRAALRRFRGSGSIDCLVMGINDHEMSGFYRLFPRQVETVVEAQRAAARAEGCAFFDTYRAMGGPGSHRRWRARQPALAAGDMKHLTRHGRDVIAGMLYDELIARYEARPGR